MKVLLRAPLLTNSGYGVHSRQIFEWLVEKKDIEVYTECLNWGQTPWIIDREKENGLISKIMDRSMGDAGPYDISFQVQLPDEWNPELAKVNVGISAFVETDMCSRSWIEKCNNMDLVIVPSTFTKNVVRKSGILMTRIKVVPEWFNHNLSNLSDCLEISKNDERYNFNTDYNYLIIAQLTAQDPANDRKNLFNTISWLFEYHKNDENVGVILKTNFGRGTTLDKIRTKEHLSSLISRIRQKPGPKLHLVHGNMSSKEIAALYTSNNVKAYVSATRGEGYGLPLVDAAAAGVPVIATNWSGHLEFLEKDMFIPVDYDMTEITKSRVDERIFYEGFKWAEPRKSSFFKCLKSLSEENKKHVNNAKKLSEHTINKFSKESIKKEYDKILEDIRRKS
jgi:glycosyltransferase involved in cell wall biosynthesis